MHDGRDRPDQDDYLTLRAPRPAVAFLVALAVHALLVIVARSLPEPKRVPERIQLTLSQPPAPAPAPPAPPREPPPRQRVAKKQVAPPPPTSPVVPELPPSQDPDRMRLPVAEKAPAPAPPPAPSTWEDRLGQQLAATRPKAPKLPTGALAPSFGTLDRVAMSDASLHDEQTERRLMQDHGQFFRRGLEALRSNWHPGEVLRTTERDRSTRCGQKNRTTFAVAVLDKSGRVVDVDLKGASGCPGLDEEAVAAFLRVAHFPHPPEGIFVAPDGTPTETARYPVRFIVTFDGGIRLDWRG